jgi:hypothetical protein
MFCSHLYFFSISSRINEPFHLMFKKTNVKTDALSVYNEMYSLTVKNIGRLSDLVFALCVHFVHFGWGQPWIFCCIVTKYLNI